MSRSLALLIALVALAVAAPALAADPVPSKDALTKAQEAEVDEVAQEVQAADTARKARLLMARGDYKEALDLARQLQKDHPDYAPHATLIIAEASEALGDDDAAIEHFNIWLKNNGADSTAAAKIRQKVLDLGGTPLKPAAP